MRKLTLSLCIGAALFGGCAHQTSQLNSSERVAGSPLKAHELRYQRRADRKAAGPAYQYDGPAENNILWQGRLEGGDGVSPGLLNFRAIQEASRRQQLGSPLPSFGVIPLGPGNFGGRLRGLVVHPTQTSRILAGSVTGGVWRSEDGGQSWAPVADFLASTAVGSMTIDPDQPNRVFIGTGEGFFNGDAPRGAGIFVSEDFGTTWNQLAATTTPDFYYVNRIAMVPGTDNIVAATRTGLFRSTNLGTSWTRVATNIRVDGAGYQDVKTDPSTPLRMIAAHNGSAGGRGPIPTIELAGGVIFEGPRMGFGGNFPVAPVATQIVITNDGAGTLGDACEALPAGSLSGRYGFADRGQCAFTVKALNMQNAGAVGFIIGQNTDEPAFSGGGTDPNVTIHGAMISRAQADTLRSLTNNPDAIFRNGFELAAPPASVNATISGPLVLTNFLARSIDGGATWTQLTAANGLPESDMTRQEIGWGPGGVVYTSIGRNAPSAGAGETRGLYRSNDGGTTWTAQNTTTQYIERQAFYDLVTMVDPTNANKVFVAAVDQYVSTDGGVTLTKNSFWNPSAGQIPKYIHADHHVYAFKPGDANTLYTGSDGGVQVSRDGGTNYESLNFGLDVAMPNNVSVSPDGSRMVTGTQDNGSHIYIGNSAVWLEWSGGDGGVTALDPQQPNFIYSTRPFGSLFGSSDYGNSEAALPAPGAGANTNGGNFYPPVVIDPANPNRLMMGLGALVYTQNARALAAATFTSIALPAGSAAINSAAFNPFNANEAFVGTNSGRVFKVSALNATPTVASIQGNLPLGSDISQILIDPNDNTGNTLYVVLADYGTNRVYKSTNGGTAWTSLHGNLPNVPAFSIAVDPAAPSNLLVGTEVGTYYGTLSGGTYSWAPFTYGLPATRTLAIVPSPQSPDVLHVAVYGRGVFKVIRSPISVSVGEFTADTGCDSDGNLDGGETAQLAVKVKNLTNTAISGASLQLSSSNAAIAGSTVSVPLLAANAELSVNIPVTLPAGNACPAPITFTATPLVSGVARPAAVATRTIGVDQNTVVTTGFTDGAESANTLMVSKADFGPSDWQRVNTQANTGTQSFFAPNVNGYSELTLTSPWLTVNAANASLNFALRYDTEGDATQRWDGVVLEARTRSGVNGAEGKWQDIGSLGTVAYDGVSFNNTALGVPRRMWSGLQTTWRNSAVPLSSFNGQQLQFRFRAVSDGNTVGTGFWLDDINVTGVTHRAFPICDTVCN
jgi:hypothetical protein